MARIPLADESNLDGFVKEVHDGAAPDDWATRHVARVFSAHPEFIEQYLAFYYPWHSNVGPAEYAATLAPRLKELVRLRTRCSTVAHLSVGAARDRHGARGLCDGVWATDFATNPG